MKVILKKKGMTLVEVLVALTIISVVLLGFISMFSGGYTNIILTGKRNKAAEEARRVMEIITEKSTSLPEDYTEDDIKNIISGITTSYTIEIPHDGFVRNYDPALTYGAAIMCKLTIKVYYDNGNKFVTLTSLINQ